VDSLAEKSVFVQCVNFQGTARHRPKLVPAGNSQSRGRILISSGQVNQLVDDAY
jgi:hypothetical protein